VSCVPNHPGFDVTVSPEAIANGRADEPVLS